MAPWTKLAGGKRAKPEEIKRNEYWVKTQAKVPALLGSSGQSCWAGGLEVLIMVREMSPVLLVDELTGLLHILGHARGTTAEYSNLSDLGMNFLQRVEERLKGRAAKVGDRAQAREQTPVQHLLEVPLTDVQHGGPEVKLLSQLGDIDVHRHQVLVVILLHLPDDVSQPLKLSLSPCHPNEVDLLTEHLAAD